MPQEIPFNRPFITGKELEYIARIIADRKLSADGFYTACCARLLQDRSDDPEEPLRVYADLSGHPFCIFSTGPLPD